MKIRQTISMAEAAIVSRDLSSISMVPTIRPNCPLSPSVPFVHGW
jgi:hypothetical protein